MALWRNIVAAGVVWGSITALPAAAQVAPPPAVRKGQAFEPGYLGAIGTDRTEAGRGVRIVAIDRDSPADEGSLRVDDLIVMIDDQPIKYLADMRKIMERAAPGTKLTFHVNREGMKKQREVTLGERPPREKRAVADFGPIAGPPAPPTPPAADDENLETIEAAPGAAKPPVVTPPPLVTAPPRATFPADALPGGVPPLDDAIVILEPPTRPPLPRASLGVQTIPVTETDRWELDLPHRRGALVTAVTIGSAADKIDLPVNAVIVALDGKAISNPTDLARRMGLLSPHQEVEVSYYVRGELLRKRTHLTDGAESTPIVAKAGSPDAIAPHVIVPPPAPAPPPAAADQPERIKQLEAEVAALKARLEKLEAQAAGGKSDGR